MPMTQRPTSRPRPHVSGLAFCLFGAMWCSFSCGGAQTSHPQPDFPQDAILAPETVEVTFFDEGVPQFSTNEDGEVVEQGLHVRTQGLVGEKSRFTDSIVSGLEAANYMIQPWLRVIRDITRRTPTLSDENIRIWRFEGERFVYSFYVEVRPETPNRFEYSLFKARKGADDASSIAVMNGFYRPGPRTEQGRQTGEGVIRTRYGAFTPNIGPQGVGAFSFRITPNVREFRVLFYDFQTRPTSTPLNARYSYRLRNDLTGQFAFATKLDITDRLPGDETLLQGVLWNADRSGRGFAAIQSDSAAFDLLLDECWDSDLRQVWTEWNFPPDGETNDGDQAQCGVLRNVRPDPPDIRAVDRDELPEIPPGE